MAAPLPQRSSALQSTLGISLGAHVVLAILIALTARRAPVVTVVPPPVEPIELDGSDLSAMDSGKAGREDLAQGARAAGKEEASPPEPDAPGADPPAPAPKPEPPKADPPKPPDPPKADPPKPAEPKAPEPAPPAPPAPTATDVEPPSAPTAPTPIPPKTKPKRTFRSRNAQVTPAPASSSSSDAGSAGAASSATAPPGDAPGEEGGPVRATAKDVAASFVHELPLGSDAIPAWQTLPVGDVGETTIELAAGDDGRLVGETTFTEKNPNEVLVEMVRRTRGRLRTPMAISGKTAGPGTIELKLRARIETVPIPEDIQGTFYNLASSFHGDHGDIAFSLPVGRRITVSIDVLSRSPR